MSNSIEAINQQPLENPELDRLLELIDIKGEKYRDFATVLMEGIDGFKFTIQHRTQGVLYESKFKTLDALIGEYEDAFQNVLKMVSHG